MANVTAQVSYEPHYAQDTTATPAVIAAKKGLSVCSLHPGCWISRPTGGFGIFRPKSEVRDCPDCVAGT